MFLSNNRVMDPITLVTSIITLANTVCQLILKSYEKEPAEIVRARSIVAFTIGWAIIQWALPAEVKAQVETELAKAKA